jgi:hypothetical protein
VTSEYFRPASGRRSDAPKRRRDFACRAWIARTKKLQNGEIAWELVGERLAKRGSLTRFPSPRMLRYVFYSIKTSIFCPRKCEIRRKRYPPASKRTAGHSGRNGCTPACSARSQAEAVEIFAARQHYDYTSREHVQELAAWFAVELAEAVVDARAALS